MKLVITFFMFCSWASAATAHDAAAFCKKYPKPIASAVLLNEIGAGHINRLIACKVIDVDEVIPNSGEHITPLQFAATLGKPALVEQILHAGANPNFGGREEDGSILYPLELALSGKKYDAAKVLINMHANAAYALPHTGMTALIALSINGDNSSAAEEISTFLIAHGASMNAADRSGNTPTHWAARMENIGAAHSLIKAGADVCTKNNKGQQPGDIAALKKNAQLVTLLKPLCPSTQ